MFGFVRLFIFSLVIFFLVRASFASQFGPITGLPLPRFVSMKTTEGNVRRGPSMNYQIDWVFKHPNTPLKITAEHGHWRRVEDYNGEGGWMHYSLLSGIRMVLVIEHNAAFRIRPNTESVPSAFAEKGAILSLLTCASTWCEVRAAGQRGWMKKTQLWGIWADEQF